jgi:hypothetical protein
VRDTILAATNKCLAKSNKSPDGRGATKKQAANERVSAAAEETRSRRAPKESENGKRTMLHLPSPFYGIWQQRLADKQMADVATSATITSCFPGSAASSLRSAPGSRGASCSV